MFDGIRQQMFAAKLMAEIKAQHPDQDFVNRLFSTEWIGGHLHALRTVAPYRDEKHASFWFACEILKVGMGDEDLPRIDRITCGQLIVARLHKVKADPMTRWHHNSLVDELEDAMSAFTRHLEDEENQHISDGDIDALGQRIAEAQKRSTK